MPVRPPTFRPRHLPTRHQREREYDAHRGSARERGYTHRWDQAASRFKLAHPLCVMCEREGRVTASYAVDHIIPHKGDQALFWDEANWQPLCRPHHDRDKQREERRRG